MRSAVSIYAALCLLSSFLFLAGGKGGNASCVGLQHGLLVGLYAGDPGHIPCLLSSCPVSYFQLPSYPLLWPDSGCTIMERGSYGQKWYV